MRKCCVCSHPHRQKIEALVVSGLSQAKVAAEYGVDRSALSRHMKGGPGTKPHISPAEVSAYLCGASEVEKLRKIAAEQNGSVLDDLMLLRAMCFKQLHEAATVKDGLRFAALAGRFLDIIESHGKVTGEIQRLNPSIRINNTISITASPQFLRLQRGLMKLVLDHPELRAEITALLREGEEEERAGLLAPPQQLEAPRAVA